MKNSIYSFLFFCMLFSNLSAQNLHIVRMNNTIYELMPSGYLAERVEVNFASNFSSITDIAISPSNKLYGIVNNKGIIEIDWQTGDFERISSDSTISTSSLVSASENELYYISTSNLLFQYDIEQDSSVLIDDLGYDTPGDLCFYKGNLIFPTHYDIKAYNLETNTISTIYCFPEVRSYFGIALVDSDCDSTRVYVPNPNAFANPTFQILDLQSGAETNLATNNSTSIDIYGMANQLESEANECPTHNFRDINCDDIVSNQEHMIELSSFSIYPNPVEDYLHLKNISEFEMLYIYNNQGIRVYRQDEFTKQIDLELLNAGMYYIEIHSQNKSSIRKFIKY